MYEEHARVACKTGRKKILSFSRFIRYTVLVAPKGDIIASKTRQNAINFPNYQSSQNGSYVPRFLEQVIVANMETQFSRFLLKNVQFIHRCFALFLRAHINWRRWFCINYFRPRIFIYVFEVVCCASHWNVLIRNVGPTHHPRGQIKVEEQPQSRVKHLKARIPCVYVVPCQQDRHYDTLVDACAEKVSRSLSKLTTMPQDKSAQTSKLGKTKIRETRSLISFFSQKSNANMRRLNHVHIVGSVPDCERYFAPIIWSNKLHHLCLLLWRGPINHNRICIAQHPIQLTFLFNFGLKHPSHRSAVY